ncbi:hypothetical protein BN1723_015689 [Verticillium longisporum]|uniref:Uncharacterized protein n=1 Tax=Verticillium longisporum TaxID=100787 RepID=A0A0G4N1C4_VERLO|nr:hypothetical protein BN1723_015689 [Verticillium longisporum]
MPRFSVGFGRRKSTAAEDVFQNVEVASNEPSSFRVLERTDVSAGKSFDGGVRMGMGRATTSTVYQKPNLSQSSVEDNMFADLKPSNRDFGQMFDNKFKRNSAMTLRAMSQDDAHKIAQSGNHHSQNQSRASHLVPAPIQIDKTAKVEASPYSWSSQHSNDNLLNANSNQGSPLFDQVPPPVPRHDSPHSYAPTKRPSDIVEDEDANLLKDSMAASRFLDTAGEKLQTTRKHLELEEHCCAREEGG